jgi:hypothetical protein
VSSRLRRRHGWPVVLALVQACGEPILLFEIRRRKMSKESNFFKRALNALVEGRTRQAERYVAQYERDHVRSESKVNKH